MKLSETERKTEKKTMRERDRKDRYYSEMEEEIGER
jgi:hypothetical protein